MKDNGPVIKKVSIGDILETCAGSFKILDIFYSDWEQDYEAKVIWTMYKPGGGVYDVSKIIISFEVLADYISYTTGKKTKLLYKKRGFI